MKRLLKPEYIFQPGKLLDRIRLVQSAGKGELKEYPLPFGGRILANNQEEQGKILSVLGVVDLVVTETLFRLSQGSKVCVDAGANIGYMTAVMASGLGSSPGSKGTVHCFEPHPKVHDTLTLNLKRWVEQYPEITFKSYSSALSSGTKTLTLVEPVGFDSNHGLGQLQHDSIGSGYSVSAVSLDSIFVREQIDVLKIDVEGHEENVLHGAEKLLAEKRIKYLVFEEHRAYPSSVTSLLQQANYHIFRLDRGLFRPRLSRPLQIENDCDWLPTSYLAVRDVMEAKRIMGRYGWSSLRKG